MAKQIALFNHKGGVSKTTSVFNLGWMLSKKGKKVIIADCDPQCNLTGMVLGLKKSDEFDEIYKGKGIRNIRDGLAPAFESRPTAIEPVTCVNIKGQGNLGDTRGRDTRGRTLGDVLQNINPPSFHSWLLQACSLNRNIAEAISMIAPARANTRGTPKEDGTQGGRP
jgi:hypothetical protein